jgi:LysM repeat protein
VAGVLPASPAGAQEHCGGEYVVRPGDALAGIAARCDSTVTGLVRANSQVSNPNRIDVGWRLTIPEALGHGPPGPDLPGEGDDAGDDETRAGMAPERDYTVQPGDTLAGIARSFGLSIASLLAANEGIDPSFLLPGQRIRLPGAGDGRLEPEPGPDRTAMVLEGRVGGEGVCPTLRTPDGDRWHLASQTVTITPGEYVEVRGVRTERTACPGRTLAVKDIAEIAPPGDGGDETPRVRLEGRVTGAGNCPTLRTPAGDEWRLVSERVNITPGEYVEVRGKRVDFAGCEGPVLAVAAIAEVSPPDEERGEREPMRLEGRVAEGPECPVLRTPDGEVYSVVSGSVRFTPGEYVEVTGQPVEMSFCMRGTTIEVSDLREVPAPSGG